MLPILFDSITNGVVPEDFGIGVLKDTISCEVTEERNGSYELKLKYPSSGAYASQIVNRAIIKAKPNFTDEPQLFRIYKVGKAIGSSFTVYARHISYDLSGYPIVSGNADDVSDALTLLQNATTGYTFSTDKSLHANFKISEPSSVRSWLGGKTGSILDVYGPGEYKYDNFNISFLASRGTDRGVTIRYGKNLTKLESTEDSSNLVTGVMAFWKSSEDDTTIISDTISTHVTLDVVHVSVLDASNDYEEAPTRAQLNDYVNRYINNHEVRKLKQNFKLDFIQISQLLKDRVDLCDTVAIIYEDFGISLTAKCISTTWDVIEEKYTEIELGEPKTNIADTITSINKSLGDMITSNEVRQAINNATDLITGNKGGYIVMHDSNSDGEPDELLIMNTPDITTATKVWRWNLSGLGYSSTGYSGTFGLAMTMDGAIVADYVKTGNLVFGGGGNTNGKLEIRDATGNIICRFDKTGADVKGHIQAESFTADASNGVKVDIVTETISTGASGIVSGAIAYHNNKPLSGVGVTLGSQYSPYRGTVFVKDPDNIYKAAYMRHFKSNVTNDDHFGFETFFEESGNRADSYFRAGKIDGKYCGQMSLPCVNNLDASRAPAIYFDGSTNSYRLGYIDFDIINQGVACMGISFLQLQQIGKNPTITFNSADGSMNGASLWLRQPGQGYTITADSSTGNVRCVSLTQTSSKEVKHNIESITSEEAAKILKLRPVTFDFNNESLGTDKRGFIAEEVQEVIPELVHDDNDVKSLDYISIIPYLTKVIQDQQTTINDLLKRVEALESRKEN